MNKGARRIFDSSHLFYVTRYKTRAAVRSPRTRSDRPSSVFARANKLQLLFASTVYVTREVLHALE